MRDGKKTKISIAKFLGKVSDNSKQKQDVPPALVAKGKDVRKFLEATKAVNSSVEKDGLKGRIIFALDATMSRQPTWDTASQIQSEMFTEAHNLGGLLVDLVFFRGFGECQSSGYLRDAKSIRQKMSAISCRGGQTQILKILKHALKRREEGKLGAVVYIGDCVEENPDRLCELAGQLGLRGVPLFLFQEGQDTHATNCFKEMARLSRGVHHKFDQGAAHSLAQLLAAIAVYTSGGREALEKMRLRGNVGAQLLLTKMRS
ncbi:VWA domain-containing protein [Polycladidibacter stylochi]|uniref:VWA domain-containing protein n=1 Tax=Polycladidibacter stylochi TaxID=1807766 RepID=UPI000AC2E80D|nr:VWA domain-containing protein [Pseudovibrio stylochi]